MTQSNNLINIKKAAGILKLSCTLSSKLSIQKTGIFYNLRRALDTEFSKTIQSKIYDQFKTKASPTTESPIKSLISSKLSQAKELELKSEDFLQEKKEKIGKILEKLHKKCQNIERVGETTFTQWKTISMNKEKGALMMNYSLKNIYNKQQRSFINQLKGRPESQTDGKNLKLANVMHKLQNKQLLLSVKVFHTLKQKENPFEYMKKLSQLVNALKMVKQRNLLNGLCCLKSNSEVFDQKSQEQIKKFVSICNNLQKNYLNVAFSNLQRPPLDEAKAQKINMTNRLKGRILIGCYKQAPVFSLKTAFLKFRVRSDQKLVKKSIDRSFFI